MIRWLVAVFLVGAATAVAGPLDKPAFTATPAELLALAKPSTGPAIILRYDVLLDVDSRGRRTKRLRVVYAVTSKDGVDGWSELFHIYRPFFQTRPAVRARVIAPDRSVVELDPKTVTDVAMVAGGDRRKVLVPLPTIAIGSIVEEEVVIRDREPILGPLGAEVLVLGDVVPTASLHVVVSAPVARKLQVQPRNLPVAPRHEVTGTTERWIVDTGLPATREREDHAPGDVTTAVQLVVGTAPSWQNVARNVRTVLDRRIADGPVSLPTGTSTAATIETVHQITAWVRSKVAFDGVTFADSAVVPAAPSATLQRAKGDSKDIATLLIALLRQASIRADLVLISDGPDADLATNVPGLDLFDRVLVRARLADHDIWIDIDEPLAAPNVLSIGAAGRKALVIADDTTSLVETPRSRSTDNVIREVRTFEIPEYGNSRVTIVTRVGGALEAEYRQWIRDADDLEAELRENVRDQFVAKDLEHYATSDVVDLTKPFELTTVATGSMRANAEREMLTIYLFPSDTASRFHEVLRDTPRSADFVWRTPHVYEIENRLAIPDGFALPVIAAPSTRKLGTIAFTRTDRLDGRTYIVTFRLDTGKSRMTPAETIATAKAMTELEDERVKLTLELHALELESKGKVKEAIAELERLSKLHPKEALHHSQVVPIYIRAGMGTAARREARTAVQLQPADADAQVVLAWALRRDSLGLEYGFDHDRAGAIAAYQRARKLDPSHIGAMADYASLLSSGASGRSYDRGADARAAVVQWRDAATADPDADYSDDLIKALIQADQFREAEQVAFAAPSSSQRDYLLIAAIAGGPGGVPAALAKASTLAKGAAVNALIDSAAAVLFASRNYEPMRALWGYTGKYVNTPFANVVTKLRRIDTDKRDRSDPRVAYREGVHWLSDLAWPSDALSSDELAASWRRDSQAPSSMTNYGHALLEDLLHAAEVDVEGTGPWRLKSMFATAPIYIARDRGTAKLIAWTKHLDGLGAEVVRAIARNDQAAAFQLLDWAAKDLGTEPVGRLLATIWINSRTKDAALLAGALLSPMTLDAAIPILRDCKTTLPALNDFCDLQLGGHFGLKSPKLLEGHARAILTVKPADDNALMMLIRGLTAGGKVAEAHRLIDARLTASPADADARRAKALAFVYENKFADAIQLYETTSWGSDVAQDLNEAAWLRLLANLDLDKAGVDIRKAVEATASKPRSHLLHTLAAIEIEQGNVAAAVGAIRSAMEIGFRARPEASDWYVYARIAEHLGLTADAKAAYRKVTPEPDQAIKPPIGAYYLAQRRLKQLRP